MNWVGGSRNRLVMKNNARRQREFFEKRKMQQKLKNLGMVVPASPPEASSSSMDLVTLFVVNQIAAKKDSKDPPKVALLGSCKGGSKHRRNTSLVLPMSPCSPSQLSLAESQSYYSVQGMTKRKHVIPQGFKCRQLPPVMDSAFSSNGASHYLQPIDDPLSPFSSASSASSGQGIFPLQLSLHQKSENLTQPRPHCSSPPWDSFGRERTKPRDTTGNTPWSCGSNLPLYQLETPTTARVLFESPESDKTEVREHARHEVSFSLSQSEDKECMFDFMLNQWETEQQFEEDVFRGLSNEEYKREGIAKSKIYLKDETYKSSTPQTLPDSECVGVEFSNCRKTNVSGSGHTTGPMNGCDCLPSYSCKGGYLSSDSSDGEECCQPCLYSSASSNMDQVCCADNPNSNQGSQSGPLTPLKKPTMNLREEQEVMEKMPCPDKACRSNGQRIESSTVPYLSHHPLALSEDCRLCKCKKTSTETRDEGTQTDRIFTAEMCNASNQCDNMTKATGFSLYLPPVDVSVQLPASRRQTDIVGELKTYSVSPEYRSGGKHTPWSKKSKEDSLSGRRTINKFNNSDSKAIPPTNHFLEALSRADNRGKENGEARVETGQQENVPLMKGLSDEVREEVTSATKVNRLSEEAKALQEIANILLLLKQRKKDG